MENKWYVGNNSNDSQGLIIEENTGRNVAVSYDPKDAALIAAAPELLAVLEVLENITNIPAIRHAANKAGYMAQFGTAKDAARRVIREANGE